ncbi:ABC transporter ATP-binding protein [Cryptosporangium sp. NPDC048952]|uniref:ABC transporter ATP-binding protein n=1 Tax=Cryptosporangium sp. NPDC048952 TaxID=3363961 RepID=UPI00371E5D58
MSGEPVLRAEGLSKRFQGLQALDDVNLHVNAGEVLALIGPNGAGKTTLFNVLAGRHRPTSGRIFVDGRDVTAGSLRRRVQTGVAATFQIPRQFDEVTVEEAVGLAARYGRPKNRSTVQADSVQRHCQEFSLDPRAQIGRLDLHSLKMLEMCRAVAVAPKVLLLDEVASGLDHGEREAISAMVARLAATGCAVIVVEHSVEFVRRLCSRAVVLSFGQVLARGTVDEVLADEAVAKAYLGQVSDESA